VNSYSSIPARSEIFLCSTNAEHQMPSTLGTTPLILLDSTLGLKPVMFLHDYHFPSSMGESPATERTCYSSSIDNWVDCASSVDCCSTLTTGFYGVDVKHSVDIVYLPVSTLSHHSRGSLIFSTQFVKVCALSFVVNACFGTRHVFFLRARPSLLVVLIIGLFVLCERERSYPLSRFFALCLALANAFIYLELLG
jgi:hypothetical protein